MFHSCPNEIFITKTLTCIWLIGIDCKIGRYIWSYCGWSVDVWRNIKWCFSHSSQAFVQKQTKEWCNFQIEQCISRLGKTASQWTELLHMNDSVGEEEQKKRKFCCWRLHLRESVIPGCQRICVFFFYSSLVRTKIFEDPPQRKLCFCGFFLMIWRKKKKTILSVTFLSILIFLLFKLLKSL